MTISHTVAAHIDEQNGYLVYNVMMIDPGMNFSRVIVDPGGQVLFSKQISEEEEHMMMRAGSRYDGSSTGWRNDDGSWLIVVLVHKVTISFLNA